MAILDLTGIRKTYRKGERSVEALRGVDLAIERGEFLAVVGPSGSGKTTLLNIIGCLDVPTAGTVLYDGTALHGMTDRELSEYRKHRISFIFQSYNLIPVLTVEENVALPLVIDRQLPKDDIARRAREMLGAVGLAELGDRYPRELSGGQEQRVAIARALVKEPLVVLADEPTANLDSGTAEEIVALMEGINRERRTTFIFSTHDARVEHHARRVVTLHDGLIAEDRS